MTLQELFDRVANRLPGATPTIKFIDAAQSVQEVITNRLWYNQSELLKTIWTSTSQIVGTASVALPTTFLGLDNSENPFATYTVGGDTVTATLTPLSMPRSYYVGADNAIPSEYELRATTFYLYPPSSVAFTLTVPMFQKPTELTAMGDTIPWGGLFDQVFQDTVSIIAGAPGAYALINPGIEATLQRRVDDLTTMRAPKKARFFGVF
jgi:hypothetical protein